MEATRAELSTVAQEKSTGAQVIDFSQCMREYGPAFRRLAASYEADPGLQEDLFQEICLGIWRALPRFKGASSLRTYLYRVAHNQALRHLTRRRRQPFRPDDEAEVLLNVPDPSSTPEISALERDQRRRLAAQIRRLPLSLRQPLVLKLEGLSDKEIGETLELRTGTVSVRLTRARQALADGLVRIEKDAGFAGSCRQQRKKA